MPETVVYKHKPPRNVGATLTWARGLLILILLGWAFRQVLSVRDGLAAERYHLMRDAQLERYDTDPVLEYVCWPLGMTVLCLGLLGSSVTRFLLDRRAMAAMRSWAGATVREDGLELRLIGRLGCHATCIPWGEVVGAQLYSDVFNAPHVLVQATRRRRYKLPPYMEDAEGFVAEVSTRARGVSRR